MSKPWLQDAVEDKLMKHTGTKVRTELIKAGHEEPTVYIRYPVYKDGLIEVGWEALHIGKSGVKSYALTNVMGIALDIPQKEREP